MDKEEVAGRIIIVLTAPVWMLGFVTLAILITVVDLLIFVPYVFIVSGKIKDPFIFTLSEKYEQWKS